MGFGDERGNFGSELQPVAESLALSLHPDAFVERGSLATIRARTAERDQTARIAAPILQLLINRGLLDEVALREQFSEGAQ